MLRILFEVVTSKMKRGIRGHCGTHPYHVNDYGPFLAAATSYGGSSANVDPAIRYGLTQIDKNPRRRVNPTYIPGTQSLHGVDIAAWNQ